MRLRHLACLLSLALVPLFVAGPLDAAPDDPRIHHDLEVRIDPAKNHIEVGLTMTFPDGLKALPRAKDGGLEFELHGDLEVVTKVQDGSHFRVEPVPAKPGAPKTMPPRKRYRLVPHDGNAAKEVVARILYSGRINHSVTQVSEEYARSFSQTPGTIEEKGVFLGGSSWWVPRFGSELVTFRMHVTLPEGWSAVSQGVRPKDAKPKIYKIRPRKIYPSLSHTCPRPPPPPCHVSTRKLFFPVRLPSKQSKGDPRKKQG